MESRSEQSDGVGIDEIPPERKAPFCLPLHDYVLILPDPQKEEIKGGIIRPDITKEEPMRGRIVAMGPGRVTEQGTFISTPRLLAGAIDVAGLWVGGADVNSHVLYAKYAGLEVEEEGATYKLLRAQDVLGLLP